MPYLPRIPSASLDPAQAVAGFVDVETTGLSCWTDEVVELAFVLFAYERSSGRISGIVDDYVGLREPACPISQGALRVHGITPSMLRGKRLDHQRIERMIQAAEFLVAHNAGFDRGFLSRLFPASTGKLWLCSMSGIDWHRKGWRSRALQALLQGHGIGLSQGHRAAADVEGALLLLSREVEGGRSYFSELLDSLATRGITSPFPPGSFPLYRGGMGKG